MPSAARQTAFMVAALLGVLTHSACNEEVAPPSSPGAASSIAISSGDNQVAPAGSKVWLTVRITDGRRPVPGARVLWSVEEGGGTVTPTSISDASGIATTDRELGPEAGTHLTRATLEYLNGPFVRFASISQIQGATRIELLSGNEQRDTVLATLAPYQVLVRNHLGARVQGVDVQWLLRGPGSLSSQSSKTDASGVAHVVHTLGRTPGLIRVEALVDGLIGSPINFNVGAIPGVVTVAFQNGGDGQLGIVGGNLRQYYSAGGTDSYGNFVSPAFSWEVTSGGGTISISPSGPSAALHQLGPSEGVQTVTATLLSGSRPQVSFSARAVSALVMVVSSSYAARRFLPDSLGINIGTSVAWEWEGCDDYYHYCTSENHNITFEDAPNQPNSSPDQSSGVHIRTFVNRGTIRYRCTNHSTDFDNGMVGKVIVH